MKDPLLINHEYSESPFGFGSSSSSSSSSRGGGCPPPPPTRSTISTSESGQELWPVGVKLGIVRLGHAAGKLKYTLVDEQDIVLAREYTFEARLEVDILSGSGAVVFAYAYLTSRQSRQAAILLQDLIWRRHNGPIPERQRVVHRNHISMDNRLDNLCLIDIRNAHVWYTRANAVKVNAGGNAAGNQQQQQQNQPQPQAQAAAAQLLLGNDKACSNDLHLTLYWAAIQQLPPEQQAAPVNGGGGNAAAGPNGSANNGSQSNEVSSSSSSSVSSTTSSSPSSSHSSAVSSPSSPSSSHHSHHHHHSHSHHRSSSLPKCYDAEGNLIDSEEGGIVYYECHYPPCVRIEREPREFSICGRCQETRYCGTVCQQLDWPHHKRSCRSRSSRRAPYPSPSSSDGGSSSSRWGQQQQQ